MHGFSLNCQERLLPWFGHISPCGLGADKQVTCIESEITEGTIDMNECMDRIVHGYSSAFDVPSMEIIDEGQLNKLFL